MATGTIPMPANSSGSGYCKMPDGTLIQWGYHSGGTKATTQTGALYLVSYDPEITFPTAFADTPIVEFSPMYDNYCIIVSANYSATGISKITVGRPNSGSIYPRVGWLAVGRWK